MQNDMMFQDSKSRIRHFLKHKHDALNITIPDFLTLEFWGDAFVTKDNLWEFLLEVVLPSLHGLHLKKPQINNKKK